MTDELTLTKKNDLLTDWEKCLTYFQADWNTDWVIIWLTDRSAVLVIKMAKWLTDWKINYLTEWVCDWQDDWLTDSDLRNDLMTNSLTDL